MAKIAQISLIGLFLVGGGMIYPHPALATVHYDFSSLTSASLPITVQIGGSYYTFSHFFKGCDTYHNADVYCEVALFNIDPSTLTLINPSDGSYNPWTSGNWESYKLITLGYLGTYYESYFSSARVRTDNSVWGPSVPAWNSTSFNGDPNTGFTYMTNSGQNTWTAATAFSDSGVVDPLWLSDLPTRDWQTGSYWYPTPADTTTRIISFNPANASTTASTEVALSATIYNGVPNYLNLHFHIVNIECDSRSYTCLDSPRDIYLPISSTVYGTVSTTTTLQSGMHWMMISMEPLYGGDSALTTASGYFVVASTTEGVFTITPSELFATTSSTTISSCNDSGNTVAYLMCRLFVPSAATWNDLYGLGNLISTKPPASYFFAVKTALTGASTTATTSALTGFSIPAGIMSRVFMPIRTALVFIIGLFALVHFWHRLKDMHL